VFWGVRLPVAAAAAALALTIGVSAAEAAVNAHGSVEQVYVTDLTPGTHVLLVNGSGRTVALKQADARGALLFRDVRPGGGYRVRLARGGESSAPLTVLTKRPAPPSTDVYNQTIPTSGYGYMTTRDGIKLAYTVHPPQDVAKALPVGAPLPTVPSGPTPTLIEYSGYGYADPAGPHSGISILANLMGFAVVDINMRGTGCSGGAFDFFEPLQNLDGYDIVETVARQPWVLHNKVGMMGISYGGISQLFTAQLQPPSLAAISPLSVIDATQTTLYPGGIVNTGFAVDWAKERQKEAQPAGPNAGQGWAYKRIQEGDATCKANQTLHGQAADLMAKIRANDHYIPAVADPLSPVTFVDKIKVPVYMACQWPGASPGRRASGSRSRTAPTSTRWIRRRSTAGTTSCSSTSPSRRRPRTRRRTARPARSSMTRRWGSRASPSRRIRSRTSRPTMRRWRLSSSSSRSGSCSTTARARRQAIRSRASSSPSRASPSPARSPGRGT